MITVASLSPLLNSMRWESITRQRFHYRYLQGALAADFDVVFIADTKPYHLLFGIQQAGQPRALGLLFEVYPGFQCKAHLEREEYRALCQALGLKYNPNRPFSPAAFIEQFANSGQIPAEATVRAVPQIHEIPLPPRHVSDADRPYFHHWLDNNNTGNRVSEKNLKRTALSMGQRYADFCAKNNISTCWTADPGRGRPALPPPRMTVR